MSNEKRIPHGTRSRYRRLKCRCVGCQRGAHGKSIPDDLRWSYGHLEKYFGRDRLTLWYTEDQITTWKSEGLTDTEADNLSVKLGAMPWDVFSGWIEAGFDDIEVYP